MMTLSVKPYREVYRVELSCDWNKECVWMLTAGPAILVVNSSAQPQFSVCSCSLFSDKIVTKRLRLS